MSSSAIAKHIVHGEKRKLSLRVGSDPLGEVKIPVWIAAGREQGPIVTVVAGVHGCEYSGIVAASRTFASLDPGTLKGTVTIVPVANPSAFRQRSRHLSPIDQLNLDRVWPGAKHGSGTERLASVLFEQLVLRSDYVIDLHAGDLFELQTCHTKCFITGKKTVDTVSRGLAMVFTDRFFHPMCSERGATAGSLFMEAAKAGIPSTMTEAGSEGRIEKEAVEFHTSGLRRVLRWLGMVPGGYEAALEYEEVKDEVELRAERGGLFIPAVSVGDRVAEGVQVGAIRSVGGRALERPLSPIDGMVRLLFTTGVVNSGDPLMWLWQTEVVQVGHEVAATLFPASKRHEC